MTENKKVESRRAEALPGFDKPIFSWRTGEFAEQKKSGGWFFLIIIVAVALVALFIYLANWTAAGVVAAGAFALIMLSNTRAKTVSYAIYQNGIVVNDRAYPYDKMKSFWLVPGQVVVIRFEPESRFAAHINVPISADEDPEQVRLYLMKHLPEEEDRGEDITDRINRWMKF